MLLKINFNRALIISFLWHLFCIFAVTIIIVPVGVKARRLSDVSFLGSILDKESFKRELGVSPSHGHRFDNEMFQLQKESLPEKSSRIKIEKDYFLDKDSGRESADYIIGMEKAHPKVIDEASYREYAEQAVSRTILFKPPIPDYKAALSETQEGDLSTSYRVRVKVFISPDGTVKKADTLQTSGSPEIDLIATRYVKKWKFIALNPDRPQEDSEEIVLVEFE